MRLAIDVGNTHTVYGVWDGEWKATWRRATRRDETEDEIGSWLRTMFEYGGLPETPQSAICASVVPGLDRALRGAVQRFFGIELTFLTSGMQVGLPVTYEPPHAVGADRIANALGALAKYPAPIVVVDFGTATTFDTVDRNGVYVGGAILPGVQLSADALFARAAKLPSVEIKAPQRAVGKNTAESLQSGIAFGYAGAIDAIARRIDAELGGGSAIISTGGLGGLFVGLAETIQGYEPLLTLEGLLIAADRLESGVGGHLA